MRTWKSWTWKKGAGEEEKEEEVEEGRGCKGDAQEA
eukprot:COSAG01_NODE_7725_length_3082_cov_204.291988_4_plen_36_part_00